MSPGRVYYVLSKNGTVYQISRELVTRDHSAPIPFSAQDWKAATLEHLRWGAANILCRRNLKLRDIVVLTYNVNGKEYNGWFVRCSFGPSPSMAHIGGFFLWQIPHMHCMSVVVHLKTEQNDRNKNSLLLTKAVPSEELVEDLLPSCHEFAPEELAPQDAQAVPTLRNWSMQLSVMSMHASSYLGYPNCKHPLKKPYNRERHIRPNVVCSKECNFLNEIANDCRDMVVQTAVRNLIDAPDQRDLTDLLNLRLVSKEFKVAVDTATAHWAQEAFNQMKYAIHSHSASLLQAAGQHFLNAGICVSQPYRSWMLRHHEEKRGEKKKPITFFTYYSWRRGFEKEVHFSPIHRTNTTSPVPSLSCARVR